MGHNKQNVSGNTPQWNNHFLITSQCMKVGKIIKKHATVQALEKFPTNYMITV